jgi:hypothetical protein
MQVYSVARPDGNGREEICGLRGGQRYSPRLRARRKRKVVTGAPMRPWHLEASAAPHGNAVTHCSVKPAGSEAKKETHRGHCISQMTLAASRMPAEGRHVFHIHNNNCRKSFRQTI